MRDTKIKIRLSTPGLSLNVEVPEEKFMDAFREAADTLFAYATKPQDCLHRKLRIVCLRILQHHP